MSFVPVDLAQEELDAIHAKKNKKNSFKNITDGEDAAKTLGDNNNNNNNNNTKIDDLPDRIATSIYNYLIERVGIVVSSNLHELIKTGAIPMATLTEPFTRQELYPELYANLDDGAVQEILDQYETEVPPGSQFARRQERKKILHKKRQFVLVSSLDPSNTEDGNHKKAATEATAAAAAASATTAAATSSSTFLLTTPSLPLVPPSTTTTTTLPLLDTAVGDTSSTADNNTIINHSTGTTTTTTTPVAVAVVASPTMQTRQTTNHLDIWGRVPPKEPKQNVECRICGRMVSASKFAPHLDRCMGLSLSRNGGNGNSGGA
jgi:hypothetical protein